MKFIKEIGLTPGPLYDYNPDLRKVGHCFADKNTQKKGKLTDFVKFKDRILHLKLL
jgi:hypothetical protein